MTQTPPLGGRPKLSLALTQLTGSPGHISHISQSAHRLNALSTPVPHATYSPFRSAGLAPPTPYGGPMQFSPRTHTSNRYSAYTRFRLGQVLGSKPLWFILMLGALVLWWFNGGSAEMDLVRVGAAEFGRDFFQEQRTQGLQFFPASNPKIHVFSFVRVFNREIAKDSKYVGRWTSTPNRLRRDGTFPGVYFDIVVKNTSTLFLSLHNAADQGSHDSEATSTGHSNLVPVPTAVHVPFRPISSNEKPSPPVSLLARIDQEEYVLLPKASALVSICDGNLSQADEHRIRVVAPMTDDHGQGVLALEGLWLSQGGKLLRVEGSLLSVEYENEDAFSAENDQVGERHRTGLSGLLKTNGNEERELDSEGDDDVESSSTSHSRNKVLEIITDSPGSMPRKRKVNRTGGADGLLAGIMGWEYFLGEMFGADHIGIGVDGMCLIQNCIGGIGQPNGIGDVFFRSGPFGLEHFEHPWMFDSYVPDVIILNIGESDHVSFNEYASKYDKSAWELSGRFENTYISLIKGIRTLAYPQHPSVVHSKESGHHGYISDIAPAFIPIFIMRPLRGQLEHSTQNVVARLRADGDKAVFWLDTSGWLEVPDDSSSSGDYFLDDTTSPPKWRLTEQGNLRAAIFLHMHVCRYLAGDEEKCAFLPQEVYQGKVYDPAEADFDRYLENEKEKKLKKLFWDEDADNDVEAGLVV
ncbi:hypothetical protein MMC07_001962 [Pseudocyphellaria aurata]|nr:hypothetical protein [Pseudocyphellaria aurata]